MRPFIPLFALLILAGSCPAEEPRLDEKDTGTKAARAGAAGALGGLVFGVITRDPNKVRTAVATGAAAATVTAVVDGTTATKGDKQKDEWERRFGDANADAIVHLVKRDYAKARKRLADAATGEPDHAKAARWLKALIARDTGDEDAEKTSIEGLMQQDPSVTNIKQVKERLDGLQKKLAELRKEYGPK